MVGVDKDIPVLGTSEPKSQKARDRAPGGSARGSS